MGYALRTEDPEEIYLITTRTLGSRLWFINNKPLEYLILAYLAKYAQIHGVELYAFILMGNHYHLMARFPRMNKSEFMRSFNSIIAKLVASKVENYEHGRLWSRRYADQAIVGGDESLEHYYFYCALNPVLSGVSKSLREYELYNSFTDSISGKKREFKLFNRMQYNQDLNWKKRVRKRDYIKKYILSFKPLPQSVLNSKVDYKKLMLDKLSRLREEAIEERQSEGKGFAAKETRKQMKSGAKPRHTKTIERYGFTPIVLSLCIKSKYLYLEQYFIKVNKHREASEKYRRGELVEFPPGTYRPPSFCGPPVDFQQAA